MAVFRCFKKGMAPGRKRARFFTWTNCLNVFFAAVMTLLVANLVEWGADAQAHRADRAGMLAI
jgi:hypothetical protein